MNCFTHTDTPAVAFCRTCGKGLCVVCKRDAQGTVFCAEHVPAATAEAPGAPPPPYAGAAVRRDLSPRAAFVLGLIPGVGAIYNGQYGKGLVHAIVFGLLVSIAHHSHGGTEPLIGILTVAWVAYMAMEASHTAKRLRAGEAVDEFSSLVNLRGQTSRFPTGPLTLIVVGVILLLNTLDVIDFERILRYWPALLIFAGIAGLLNRESVPAAAAPEVQDEPR